MLPTRAWLINFRTYLCFIPLTLQFGLNTGSVTKFKTCGSSDFFFNINLCPFGPFAWTLYCQKYFSFFALDLDCLLSEPSSLDSKNNKYHNLKV